MSSGLKMCSRKMLLSSGVRKMHEDAIVQWCKKMHEDAIVQWCERCRRMLLSIRVKVQENAIVH